jgi:hypothetical protein
MILVERNAQSTPDVDMVEAIIYQSKLLASRDGQSQFLSYS